MQICHSLRRKQVDMSTADQLISTFRNNTGTRLSTFRSKCRDGKLEFLFFYEKVSTYTRRSKHVVVSCVDAECEVFDPSRRLPVDPPSSQGVYKW